MFWVLTVHRIELLYSITLKIFETDNDLQSFPLLDPSVLFLHFPSFSFIFLPQPGALLVGVLRFYASLDLPCYCNVLEHDI